MQTSLAAPRAAVYRGLAQFLAGDEPPPWLADPGSGWPFYQDVLRLADHSAASRTAAQAMEDVPASSWVDLTEDYQTLLVQTEPPYFLFYESTWLSGRILGPQVFSVASFYRSAGLEVSGSELPDHASLELEFLAILAETGQPGRESERQFLRAHAGRWLPRLGKKILNSGHPVFTPLGILLTNWLEETLGKRTDPVKRQRASVSLPALTDPDSCSLCGFCVQVCPAHALTIRECISETALWLQPALCLQCCRCEQVCHKNLLRLVEAVPFSSTQESKPELLLRQSLRAVCRVCGTPTVSLAEMDYLKTQLSAPGWLDLCCDCRWND
jgi:TorA maturation chaperone TorD/NAD-dependent dihydropyrimidine dehydrogenase PreA subunit